MRMHHFNNLIINQMTKKHYVKLAQLYKELLTAPIDNKAEIDGIEATIYVTMRVLEEANPSFDRLKFKKACGIK
jgi:hypothetical protein